MSQHFPRVKLAALANHELECFAINHGASEDPRPKGNQRSYGIHARGYLPHIDYPGLVQSIVFRLHDSVPKSVIELWQRELRTMQRAIERKELLDRLERYLNRGIGECWLAVPSVAKLVEDSLLHNNNERYDLLAWCVMPNHVHVLICPKDGYTVPRIIHSWKSFTAHAANKLLGRVGPFWFCDYFDEFMRSPVQLEATIRYIELNPVTANLAKTPEDWSYTSASTAFRDRLKEVRSRFCELARDHVPDL